MVTGLLRCGQQRKFTSPIKDPVAAGEQLKATVGVVDHGLFTGMTTACLPSGFRV